MSKKVPPIIHFFRIYFNSIGLIFPKRSAKYLIKLFSTPRAKVLRKNEIDILKTANKTKFGLDGDELKLYEWGEGDRIAMLFHGWESNAGSLGAFVEMLLEMNYKVVAFDAPAHGGSGGKRANLIYFKRTASYLLKKYKQPEVVIGHSLGADAIIMTALVEEYDFEKVVLIAPLNRLMAVFEEMKALLNIPEKIFHKFIDQFSEWAGYQFREFYFHDYGKQTKLKNVLIFHDTKDRVTDFSHAKDFAEHWPAVELESIEGSGHYKILWNKEVLEKTKIFLKK